MIAATSDVRLLPLVTFMSCKCDSDLFYRREPEAWEYMAYTVKKNLVKATVVCVSSLSRIIFKPHLC